MTSTSHPTATHGVPAQVVDLDTRPVHRSFRLTRPGAAVASSSQVRPALVLPEREGRALLAAAGRDDVSNGGHFSAGPAGIQVWSGPWTGPGGSKGDAVHLGSVDWSYDTPVRHYITIYRVMVTAVGAQHGETAGSLLAEVLGLAGLVADGARISLPVPPPRDPFRAADLRARAGEEGARLS